MPRDHVLEKIADKICNARGYTLQDMVGEGAFKQTFVVETQTGEVLALKVFRQAGASPRTEREFAAMRTCNHPNIISLIELDQVDVDGRTVIYCIEEFLSGGTLGNLLANGPLDRNRTVNLGGPLISAVSHIASHALVHRDIKPENILFRADETTPVIVDFGIVRDLVRSPLTKSWVLQGPGTPYYAAPEQLNNDRLLIDWRTDQFALGVTLFMAHFGYHPYGVLEQSVDEVISFVAERRGPSREAMEAMRLAEFDSLFRMVQPWPVNRFRRPEGLEAAWPKMED